MKLPLLILSMFFIHNGYGQTKIGDSSKIYYKKYVLYQALFNQEIARINRFKNPQLTKKVLRYQDSCVKYQLLLNKLSK